ncbi:ras family-domain-containing protein [Whalleya microplaca]|nr:ras family-domain-containing protein [Whalleya microplaca]
MARFLKEHKISVLGDDGVGKTSLINRMCFRAFIEEYDPTLEDSSRMQAAIDGRVCILDILDTFPQEEYTALQAHIIRTTECSLLVYSISSRQTFEGIRRYRQQIQTFQKSPMPYLLVGNKSDLTEDREVSVDEGTALARELGCEFVETSAKNGTNVENAFHAIVRTMTREQQALLETAEREAQQARPHSIPEKKKRNWTSGLRHLLKRFGSKKNAPGIGNNSVK